MGKKEDKAAARADVEAKAAAAAEDAEWADGTKGKGKKAAASEEKAAEAARRKELAKSQEESENAELDKPKPVKGKTDGKKLTRAEIAAKAMAAMEAKAKEEKKAAKEVEVTGGNEYIGALRENINKDLDSVDASGIDGALSALDVGCAAAGGTSGAKKVNMKALFSAYEERELERIKVDHPGLKLSQYKERVFAAWQKSAENPANQQ